MKKFLAFLLFSILNTTAFASMDAFEIKTGCIHLSIHWHFADHPVGVASSPNLWRLLQFLARIDTEDPTNALKLDLQLTSREEGIRVYFDGINWAEPRDFEDFNHLMETLNQEYFGIGDFYNLESEELELYRIVLPFGKRWPVDQIVHSSELAFRAVGSTQQTRQGHVLHFFRRQSALVFMQDYQFREEHLQKLSITKDQLSEIFYSGAETGDLHE